MDAVVGEAPAPNGALKLLKNRLRQQRQSDSMPMSPMSPMTASPTPPPTAPPPVSLQGLPPPGASVEFDYTHSRDSTVTLTGHSGSISSISSSTTQAHSSHPPSNIVNVPVLPQSLLVSRPLSQRATIAQPQQPMSQPTSQPLGSQPVHVPIPSLLEPLDTSILATSKDHRMKRSPKHGQALNTGSSTGFSFGTQAVHPAAMSQPTPNQQQGSATSPLLQPLPGSTAATVGPSPLAPIISAEASGQSNSPPPLPSVAPVVTSSTGSSHNAVQLLAARLAGRRATRPSLTSSITPASQGSQGSQGSQEHSSSPVPLTPFTPPAPQQQQQQQPHQQQQQHALSATGTLPPAVPSASVQTPATTNSQAATGPGSTASMSSLPGSNRPSISSTGFPQTSAMMSLGSDVPALPQGLVASPLPSGSLPSGVNRPTPGLTAAGVALASLSIPLQGQSSSEATTSQHPQSTSGSSQSSTPMTLIPSGLPRFGFGVSPANPARRSPHQPLGAQTGPSGLPAPPPPPQPRHHEQNDKPGVAAGIPPPSMLATSTHIPRANTTRATANSREDNSGEDTLAKATTVARHDASRHMVPNSRSGENPQAHHTTVPARPRSAVGRPTSTATPQKEMVSAPSTVVKRGVIIEAAPGTQPRHVNRKPPVPTLNSGTVSTNGVSAAPGKASRGGIHRANSTAHSTHPEVPTGSEAASTKARRKSDPNQSPSHNSLHAFAAQGARTVHGIGSSLADQELAGVESDAQGSQQNILTSSAKRRALDEAVALAMQLDDDLDSEDELHGSSNANVSSAQLNASVAEAWTESRDTDSRKDDTVNPRASDSTFSSAKSVSDAKSRAGVAKGRRDTAPDATPGSRLVPRTGAKQTPGVTRSKVQATAVVAGGVRIPVAIRPAVRKGQNLTDSQQPPTKPSLESTNQHVVTEEINFPEERSGSDAGADGGSSQEARPGQPAIGKRNLRILTSRRQMALGSSQPRVPTLGISQQSMTVQEIETERSLGMSEGNLAGHDRGIDSMIAPFGVSTAGGRSEQDISSDVSLDEEIVVPAGAVLSGDLDLESQQIRDEIDEQLQLSSDHAALSSTPIIAASVVIRGPPTNRKKSSASDAPSKMVSTTAGAATAATAAAAATEAKKIVKGARSPRAAVVVHGGQQSTSSTRKPRVSIARPDPSAAARAAGRMAVVNSPTSKAGPGSAVHTSQGNAENVHEENTVPQSPRGALHASTTMDESGDQPLLTSAQQSSSVILSSQMKQSLARLHTRSRARTSIPSATTGPGSTPGDSNAETASGQSKEATDQLETANADDHNAAAPEAPLDSARQAPSISVVSHLATPLRSGNLRPGQAIAGSQPPPRVSAATASAAAKPRKKKVFRNKYLPSTFKENPEGDIEPGFGLVTSASSASLLSGVSSVFPSALRSPKGTNEFKNAGDNGTSNSAAANDQQQLDLLRGTWSEIGFLLRSHINSQDSYVEVVHQALDSLRFIHQLGHLADVTQIPRGRLVRVILPFNNETNVTDQASTARVLAERELSRDPEAAQKIFAYFDSQKTVSQAFASLGRGGAFTPEVAAAIRGEYEVTTTPYSSGVTWSSSLSSPSADGTDRGDLPPVQPWASITEMVDAATRLRKLVRVKIADENDLAQAQSAVEAVARFAVCLRERIHKYNAGECRLPTQVDDSAGAPEGPPIHKLDDYEFIMRFLE